MFPFLIWYWQWWQWERLNSNLRYAGPKGLRPMWLQFRRPSLDLAPGESHSLHPSSFYTLQCCAFIRQDNIFSFIPSGDLWLLCNLKLRCQCGKQLLIVCNALHRTQLQILNRKINRRGVLINVTLDSEFHADWKKCFVLFYIFAWINSSVCFVADSDLQVFDLASNWPGRQYYCCNSQTNQPTIAAFWLSTFCWQIFFVIFENTNLMTCHVRALLYLCLCQRITSTFWECFWFRSTFPDWFSSLLDLLNIFEGVRQREAKRLGEKEGAKAAKDAEASEETERQELWQRVLKDNRVGEVAADPRSHQASKPGHSAAHTHCWVPASAIVSSLGKPVSFKPDAGRVELGGEHEGDIESHGCPKLGREGENSIDDCACGYELSQLRDSA